MCMTAPQEILSSVQWDAVTNARVSGDGGRSLDMAAMGAVLTSILGVGWSKDNVRIPTATHAGGDVEWGYKHLQILTATLSLGPVGLVCGERKRVVFGITGEGRGS